MREYTKSVIRYFLAMTFFGAEQTAKSVSFGDRNQRSSHSTESFNNVADATKTELGETFKNLYEAGDAMQQEAVDLMFNVFSPGVINTCNANQTLSEMGNQSAEVFKQGMNVMGQMTGGFVDLTQSMFGLRGASSSSEKSTETTGWGPVPPRPTDRTF